MPQKISHDKTPRWKIVKPIPPLMIPKRILAESLEANRLKPLIKASKNMSPLPNNSNYENKDTYKILLLIRELALSQEREEALNASVSKEKEQNLKMHLDFSRTKQELNDLLKKEESLSHQLRESTKIISHYEKEISSLRDSKPIAEKSSIGVGTDCIDQEMAQAKICNVTSEDKNLAHLDRFLKLCRQNEMSISVSVDQSEKLDSVSSMSQSQASLADQKIQDLNVGTDRIDQEMAQAKICNVTTEDKNLAHLDRFLELCRQNEMSISVSVDQSEKLDSVSSMSQSQASLADQKIQDLNERHQVQTISECIQTETRIKVENMCVQTDDQEMYSKSKEKVKPKVEATPEYLKFILNAYSGKDLSLPTMPTLSKVPQNTEVTTDKSVTLKDCFKMAHKNPCFKTSPKNSICTCSKKSESSRITNESSQSSTGLFLLQDETSMLVPLQDLLIELEESYRIGDTLEIDHDSVHDVDHEVTDDLSKLIEILNK